MKKQNQNGQNGNSADDTEIVATGNGAAAKVLSSNEKKLIAKKKKKGAALRQNTAPLHLMLIPAMFLVLIYNYAGMLGIVIAFQDFSAAYNDDGTIFSLFFSSPWADRNGFKHFLSIFEDIDSKRAIYNTLTIAIWKMVTMFFSPIILALSLNEVRKSFVKRTVQTVVYLPHFLSWVILAGIIVQLLSKNGIVNNTLSLLDPEYTKVSFLQDKNLFQPILIITNIWKEIGWSTIIYLAAISGVDPTLYEAAVMDGATKLKQCWHVTLPGMRPIIVLSMVLSLQGILNAGFDQIYNLYSALVYETGDVIDTLVYRKSFEGGEFSLGTAVGLFKSVISLILISISYWMAYRFAGYEVF